MSLYGMKTHTVDVYPTPPNGGMEKLHDHDPWLIISSVAEKIRIHDELG